MSHEHKWWWFCLMWYAIGYQRRMEQLMRTHYMRNWIRAGLVNLDHSNFHDRKLMTSCNIRWEDL